MSDNKFRNAVIAWMKTRSPWAEAVLGWLSILSWLPWFALWLFYSIGRFLWRTDIEIAQTPDENERDRQRPSGS